MNLGGWEIAADRFSQNSDTSGEGPQGHHKELDVTISDILDRGDPRQPLPEEKKKPVRRGTETEKELSESKDSKPVVLDREYL